MSTETVHAVLDRALDAYAALSELGEDVEEEWSYVTELTEAWQGRFQEVARTRGDEAIPDDVGAAVDRVVDEAGRITDPHRAIDWLSTFPQVVLVAIGEVP
jgi:hypothetical protein